MEDTRYEETLRCALSDEEVQERGEQAARCVAKIDQLDEERRLAASDYRDQIKELRKKLRELAQQVRERQEERPVSCEDTPDYGAGLMRTVRLDTGEVLRSRSLTYSERQGRLFPVPAPPAAKASSTGRRRRRDGDDDGEA